MRIVSSTGEVVKRFAETKDYGCYVVGAPPAKLKWEKEAYLTPGETYTITLKWSDKTFDWGASGLQSVTKTLSI